MPGNDLLRLVEWLRTRADAHAIGVWAMEHAAQFDLALSAFRLNRDELSVALQHASFMADAVPAFTCNVLARTIPVDKLCAVIYDAAAKHDPEKLEKALDNLRGRLDSHNAAVIMSRPKQLPECPHCQAQWRKNWTYMIDVDFLKRRDAMGQTSGKIPDSWLPEVDLSDRFGQYEVISDEALAGELSVWKNADEPAIRRAVARHNALNVTLPERAQNHQNHQNRQQRRADHAMARHTKH